jgi:protease IV
MKSFFKTMLASLLGALISGVLILLLAILILAGIASSAGKEETAKIEKNSILLLNFDKKITDSEPSNPLGGFDFTSMSPQQGIGLKTVLDNIAKAKADEHIDGIFMNVSSIDIALSNIEEIRAALIKFKESGKFLISYADYYSHASYYLASVSDKIYLNPLGDFTFLGLGAQVIFFKNALEKFGIEPVIIRHGKFKSAVEPFMLDKMSEANKEQMMTYVGSIWGQMLNEISEARKIEVSRLNQLADELIISSAKASVTERMVDSLAYYDEILDILMKKTQVDKLEDLKLVDIGKYTKVPKKRAEGEKGLAKDKIAVIYAEGEIVMGKSDGSNIGSESLSKTIRQARNDEKIKAIVLRVNSPGGSALASEIIWRELEMARKIKPLIVSMGELAASGGYYISCNADTIVAEPTTLTGSIGVFGLLFNIKKMLNEKIGITVDGVNTNKHSDLGSLTRKMKPEEQAFILKSVEDIYATFIGRVADGRGLTTEQVDNIGQGRVWSGVNAKEIGLVDILGGLDDAIEIARQKAKLDKYRIESFPKKKEPYEALLEMLGEEVRYKLIGEELKNFAPYYKMLNTIREMEGVQARLPFQLIIE